MKSVGHCRAGTDRYNNNWILTPSQPRGSYQGDVEQGVENEGHCRDVTGPAWRTKDKEVMFMVPE